MEGTNAEFKVMAFHQDSAQANKRVVEGFIQSSPDDVLVLPSYCRQHAAGNCVATISSAMDVTCPAFCMAKQMRSGHFYSKRMQALYDEIDDSLVFIDHRTHPDWTPDVDHRGHAKRVLEQIFHHLVTTIDDNDDDNNDDLHQARLEQASKWHVVVVVVAPQSSEIGFDHLYVDVSKSRKQILRSKVVQC